MKSFHWPLRSALLPGRSPRGERGERGLKYDSLASSCTLVDRRPPRRERPNRNHQDSFSIFSRTPTRDDKALTVYLWPIAKAIVKSTIENQHPPFSFSDKEMSPTVHHQRRRSCRSRLMPAKARSPFVRAAPSSKHDPLPRSSSQGLPKGRAGPSSPPAPFLRRSGASRCGASGPQALSRPSVPSFGAPSCGGSKPPHSTRAPSAAGAP